MEAPAIPHPAEQDLVAYARGKLDVPAMHVVREHLETCEACRQQVSSLPSGDSAAEPGNVQGKSDTATPGHSQTAESNAVKTAAVKSDTPASAAPANIPPELAAYVDYEIVRELGSGGMGVVYLARNRLMDRLEVLKVLNKGLLDKPGATERFLREIRSAARLAHPNVVGAYRAVQLGDLLVFAMEYVNGRDLSQLVKARGPLPASNASYYTYQAAVGLQHALEKGMVHRDIKPGNLMLAHEGKKHVVKVLDFGLAKASSERPIDGGLTSEGQMLGTPDYVAPEQTLNAAKADIRADIYSLGCTLYFLLSGKAPFRGSSLFELLQAHQTQEPRPLPNLPEGLGAIIQKMMAKDPAKRQQTPLEVALALAPYFKPGVKPVPIEKPQLELPDEPAETTKPSESKWGTLSDLSVSEQRAEATPKRKSAPNRDNRDGENPRGGKPWLWASVGAVVLMLGLGGMWAAGVFRPKKPKDESIVQTVPTDPVVAKVVEPIRTPKTDGSKAPKAKDNGLSSDPSLASRGLLPGFTPIFNGKDLTGWKTSPKQQGGWSVEKGVLLGAGPTPSHLYTLDDDFEDVHIRAEVKINENGNSGLFARAEFGPVWPIPNPRYPNGYEARICAKRSELDKTGSLFVGGISLKTVSNSPVPPNQWFLLELIAQGSRVTVLVNGKETAQEVDGLKRFQKGHIALQMANDSTEVQFRRVDVKRLGKTAIATPNKATDWTVGPTGATFTSLGEALLAAPAGVQIKVQPGEYAEKSIYLARDIEIVGVGPRDKIVIKIKEGAAFTSVTSKTLLRGLTVQAASGSVVEVTQGECRIEDCDLSQTGGGEKSPNLFVIRGQKTSAILKDCDIHDAPGDSGIVVFAGSLTVDNCTIVRAKNQGIILTDGAKADLRGVKVTDQGRNALWASWRCSVEASDCEFRRCPVGFPVLALAGDGRSKLIRCRVSEGEGGGVSVANGAEVALEKCVVVGNRVFGVEVVSDEALCKKNGATRTVSSLTVHEGRIANNAGVGISVKKDGEATVESCNLQNNDGGAWDILQGQPVKKVGNKE